MNRLLAATAMALALAMPAFAQTAAPAARPEAVPRLSAQDRDFVRDATAGGKAEVALGKLAAAKASNAEVKDFGRRMVEDHTKANDQLAAIIRKDGLANPPANDQKQQADYARLDRESGPAFDRSYMRMMVGDHRKTVDLFQRETSSADADLKQFASQTLPTLQNHLNMAQAIAARLDRNAPQASQPGTSGAMSGSSTPSRSDSSADELNRKELQSLQSR